MADLDLLLADTSAWHRSRTPAVAQLWRRHLDQDRIATTAPVRLEVLYSARSARDYEEISEELDSLHQLPCGETALARALEVHGWLAAKRPLYHRVAIPDLLIAAVAELGGATVWHHDRDYERIAEVTGQPIEWVAPPGTL
jgi:predicted nucleic acid-binding protein